MEKFLIVRSIPLSEETREAWKSVGGVFLRRDRDGTVPNDYNNSYGYILNLGHFRVSTGIDVVFNEVDVMRAVTRPIALRETLGELDVLPEATTVGPHWHKNPGWRGRGKVFHEDILGECAVTPGDVQKHIDGTEYRVITVGDTVVQAHKKEKVKDGDVGHFEWYWCGVDGVRRNGIIPMVKEAVGGIPSGDRTVLGWDIIVGDRPYVIEINTSPGVNDATAQRIVNAIERSLNADKEQVGA